MKQDIIYNGVLASSIKLIVKNEINIQSPEKNSKKYSIPGRDGNLVESDGTYGDIAIKVSFNYADYSDSGEIYRNAKKWLNGNKEKRLKLLNRGGYFYKVKSVKVGEEKRNNNFNCEFEAEFTCDPYIYLESGTDQIDSGHIFNQEEICHPTYLITGNGLCTITVNGKTMTASVGENLTVDTDKMISYRMDGTIINASVTGDYEDLYLQPGDNEVSVTEGFDMKVIPNWRCI